MLAIEITLLTGRYVATSEASRGESEWPPHPARLYSALVAHAAEAADSADNEPPTIAGEERAVLEWLERLPAPEIVASEARERTAVTHYVPVNDASVVGLAETNRRAAKLDELHAQLDDLDTAGDGRAARKAEAITRKIEAQLDVTSKVTDPGRTNMADALALLPGGRVRQARQWPSMVPDDPVVTLRWPDVEPSTKTVTVLDGLCGRVSRLGHSSSLVSIRALGNDPGGGEARWVPDAGGGCQFRWIQQGQLRALERAHASHLASRQRSLPKLGVSYRDITRTAPEVAETRSNLSGEWFVFALPPEHRNLPATRAVKLTKRLRDALLHHAQDPVHPIISGHEPDGRPTTEPHVAVLGLPFVGFERATGQLLGLAVLLPTEADGDAREAVLGALGSWQADGGRLRLGRLGEWQLSEDDKKHKKTELVSLHRSPWSRPSRSWVSATPLALPRHPGDLRGGTAQARARAWAKAEEIVAACCQHVDLPAPVDVVVSRAPMLKGTEAAKQYPAHRQGGQARALVHATVTFPVPVTGPVVLGSGRFLGLGLMRPLAASEEAS